MATNMPKHLEGVCEPRVWLDWLTRTPRVGVGNRRRYGKHDRTVLATLQALVDAEMPVVEWVEEIDALIAANPDHNYLHRTDGGDWRTSQLLPQFPTWAHTYTQSRIVHTQAAVDDELADANEQREAGWR